MRAARAAGMLRRMHNHPELLPYFLCAGVVELAHLRWILLTQWKCRKCSTRHADCECKPQWLRMLL
jgi:hypothetical protein